MHIIVCVFLLHKDNEKAHQCFFKKRLFLMPSTAESEEIKGVKHLALYSTIIT